MDGRMDSACYTGKNADRLKRLGPICASSYRVKQEVWPNKLAYDISHSVHQFDMVKVLATQGVNANS